MLPDQVSNPEPLTYESGALPIALRGPAANKRNSVLMLQDIPSQMFVIIQLDVTLHL